MLPKNSPNPQKNIYYQFKQKLVIVLSRLFSKNQSISYYAFLKTRKFLKNSKIFGYEDILPSITDLYEII